MTPDGQPTNDPPADDQSADDQDSGDQDSGDHDTSDQPADDPVLDPLHTSLDGLPPLLIQAASGDAVLQEAQLLAKHARACGVDTEITVYPVPTHDFHVFWSFLPEAQDALDEAGRFIAGLSAGHQGQAGGHG